jgi:hypothetical protein
MEALSMMISATVDKGLLSSFSTRSRNNDELLVSHLLFVDDSLNFCEANQDQHCHLQCLFLCFEPVLELKINLFKSKMVPVGDVDDVQGLTSILGYRLAFLPMKYLLFRSSLGASYKNTSIWNDIVEKREHRLAGWKRLNLSKGGMLTLIKSTLSQFAHLLLVPFSNSRWCG